MHKILGSEVNLKFRVHVSFRSPNYCVYYTVLKREKFKSILRLMVRMNVSRYVWEHAHTFCQTAYSFTVYK